MFDKWADAFSVVFTPKILLFLGQGLLNTLYIAAADAMRSMWSSRACLRCCANPRRCGDRAQWGIDDAKRVATLIGRDNARRLYRL